LLGFSGLFFIPANVTIEILLFSSFLAVRKSAGENRLSPLCRRAFCRQKKFGRIFPQALKNCSPEKLPINLKRICDFYLIAEHFAQKGCFAVVQFFQGCVFGFLWPFRRQSTKAASIEEISRKK